MNVAGPTSLSFLGAESPGTSNPVDAGSYQVTESDGPAGYDLSYSGDCAEDGSVVLALGQTKTCVLTNDDRPSTVSVISGTAHRRTGPSARIANCIAIAIVGILTGS